jgi:hypothetical protein
MVNCKRKGHLNSKSNAGSDPWGISLAQPPDIEVADFAALADAPGA